MKTIGLNLLGVHDSSVCLLDDTGLVFAAAEERFSRKVHDASFPASAIDAGLSFANWQHRDIASASIAWSNPQKYFYHELKNQLSQFSHWRGVPRTLYSHAEKIWLRGGFRPFTRHYGKSKTYFCDHHLAHALSAASFSGFPEATVLVLDGRGAFESTSIWHYRNHRLEPVEIISWPNSLGLFYQRFTTYLGFKALSDEWKVMGLAAYGKPGIDLSPFIDFSQPLPQVQHQRLSWLDSSDVGGIEKILGPRRRENDPLEARHKDIAFAVQQATEQAMLAFSEYAIKKTGVPQLCLAGGVVLNCKANGVIASSPSVADLFIQPAAGDDGAALGAALYPYYLSQKEIPQWKMTHAYWGPSYANEEIEKILKSYKLNYQRMSQPAKTVAELLAEDKIIGLFQGRMEFGPRALGCRSIIANPGRAETQDLVNKCVKYRETWRPFAPSILEEDYFSYFDVAFLSPFMILSFPVREEKRDSIPAVVHVDGTSRPQSVSQATNPYYWEIISEFKKKTGLPAVLNTSFNLKGEPIVCSPFDAIRTFYTSGLDAVVLEEFLVLK